MAKAANKVAAPSLMDFSEENILERNQDLSNTEESEEEEQEEEEEELEVETEKDKTPVLKKKLKTIEKKAKVAPIQEEVEEEEPSDATTDIEEEEEPEDKGQDPKAFWEQVDSITGIPLEVEYGDLDPLSPQGVALREQALVSKTVEDFIDKIAEQHPNVYKALEYATAGGNIEDLFKGEKDYSKIVLKEEDEDHAKLILDEYYEKKGIASSDRRKRMIAADSESEEGLVKTAQGVLAELQQTQEAERDEEVTARKAIAERQRAQDQKFLQNVDGLINSLKLDNFKLSSKKEAQDFSQFVRDHLQRDGKGGYMIVTPIEPQSLEKQLQAEFFKFKGGNLSQLITTKATTLNAQKLRLGMQQEAALTKKTTTAPDVKRSQSMRDYEV